MKAAVDAADPCGLLEIGRIAGVVSESDTEESIAGVLSEAFNCKSAGDRFRGLACIVRNELRYTYSQL